MAVEAADGAVTRAWVYTVVDKGALVPPSREYLAVIREAARDLGFPQAYRQRLDAVPVAER